MADPVHMTPAERDRLMPMLYHTVTPMLAAEMEALRVAFLHLGVTILRTTPPSRSQSLALTHLEEALMRTMQALALGGTLQVPAQVTLTEEVPHGD